jgi:phosphopantothenoylcysteine decarboxylase/phosphopantothenate--cysteine ligase
MLIAPAMHFRMWGQASTASNVRTLQQRGVHFVGPAIGKLASGAEGIGRMSEPVDIARAVEGLFHRDLEGLRILISAGPTHEPIDPVRFLGNRSSGKMGYAMAAEAARRGAKVTLVSGPVSLAAPLGVEVVRVTRAVEMQQAIESRYEDQDAIVMAAAVADFRPESIATEKIKKVDGEAAPTISLVRNPDILAGLGARRASGGQTRPYLVGFAVESRDVAAFARQKLVRKQVDLVVGNPADVAFEGDENEAWLVDANTTEATGRITKRALAEAIISRIGAATRRG